MKTKAIASGLVVLTASIALFAAAPVASGAVVLSTWDDGTANGWTWHANAWGRWEVLTSGGNSGGYIRFYDTDGPNVADDLHAGSAYLGDYSNLGPDARFEFDMRAEKAAAIGATIYLTGPGGTYSYRTPVPTTTWTHYVIPLQQQSWSLSSGTWSGLLANITDIHIVGDIVSGYNQAELALDNFLLLPEPATLVLLAIGGLAIRRRLRLLQ